MTHEPTGPSAVEAVATSLQRIAELDRSGPLLRSVIEVSPAAERLASERDAERAKGYIRGPLHGVPVLVKDNVDTADLPTTAGSYALTSDLPDADAPLVARLREAGAIVVGKANLSEWANFRSTHSSSGWSAVGGLCVNPHALDRSAGGSSSGSGVAVAAGLAPMAVGTETDGSIACPAALNGIVGLKPTVGLIPRTGVVPISHSQDTPGPMTRTVLDAARMLGVLAVTSATDPATLAPDRRASADYTAFCSGEVAGLRIGLPRKKLWGYSPQADSAAEAAVRLLAAHGVEVVDDADLPSLEELFEVDHELAVLRSEFKAGIAAYLATRGPDGPKTLADLIAFNSDHADKELVHFGQEAFEQSVDAPDLDDPGYLHALAECRRLGRSEGIDAALRKHGVDALVMPSYPPAWKIDLVNGDHVNGSCTKPSAVAGYPILTVPSGMVDGLPVGVAFVGTAWSEPTLLRLGYAVEQLLNLGDQLLPAFRPAQAG